MANQSDLKSLPLFKKFTEAELTQLSSIVNVRSVKRGTTLFDKGDKRKEFIILVSGVVHVYRMFNDEMQTLALLDPGDFVVESALVDPSMTHQHNAEVTRDAELLIIESKAYQKFSKNNSIIANKLLGTILSILAERLHHANNKLVTLYATGKIASTYGDLDNLIDLLLKTITATISAKKALFAWYRPEENKIVIEKALGYPNNQEIQNLNVSLQDDPLLGEIYRTQRDIYITRSTANDKPHLKTNYGGATMLGVKIKSSGKVMGAILLSDKEDNRDFSYNNQILLHIIVKQITLAIQEAEYKKEKSQKKEYQQVYVPPM
ncbi:MAG: cyclic nucleotide-binding domain-containing protein [bacterium]